MKLERERGRERERESSFFFCHFSPNLKLFKSGSLWFAFCCHFSPNLKNSHFLLF
uniref:Uncharacterized protein n=1 Tax=Helianthus annuus TaxID=4232 RepID=A0A251U5V9_HELAN